jgi:hypothetical protein
MSKIPKTKPSTIGQAASDNPFQWRGQTSTIGLKLQTDAERARPSKRFQALPNTTLLNVSAIKDKQLSEMFGIRKRYDFGQN